MTLVECDPKAPFSIATTQRSKRGRYSIPWIALLYPRSSPYNAKCKARSHQVPFFEFLVWIDLGLNPGLPDHWRTVYSLGQWRVGNGWRYGDHPNYSLVEIGHSTGDLKRLRSLGFQWKERLSGNTGNKITLGVS